MIDSKYVTILKQLSKNELQEFEKWIDSPWCTSNKSLLPLFKTIKKYYPKFLFRESDEEIYLKAFPKKIYSYNIFRNLLSHSFQAVEKFLTHEHLKNNQIKQQSFLAKEYEKRKMDEPFFKILEKEIGYLEDKKGKNMDDYFHLMSFNQTAYHYASPNSKVPDHQSIVSLSKNLEINYVLEKARVIKELIVRNRLLKNENHDIETEIKKWKVIAKDIHHPSIDLYKIRFSANDENLKPIHTQTANEFRKRFHELSLSLIHI